MMSSVLIAPVINPRIISELLKRVHGSDYVQCLQCHSLKINTKLLVQAVHKILDAFLESEDDLEVQTYAFSEALLPQLIETLPEKRRIVSAESEELWEKENAHRRLWSENYYADDEYARYEDVVLAVDQQCECLLARSVTTGRRGEVASRDTLEGVDMKDHKQLVIPLAIAAAMLLIAVAEMPYGYYQILRFVVCGTGTLTGYLFISSSSQKVKYFGYAFSVIAIVFNPFMPIHFDRDNWVPVDLACAIYFGAVAYKIKS